jgi:hypothetical protein
MSVFDFIFIQQHVLSAFEFHGCNLMFSPFGFLGWPNAKYNQNRLGYDSLSLIWSYDCFEAPSRVGELNRSHHVRLSLC